MFTEWRRFLMKHSLLSGEGSNAKVFTHNWLKNNEIDKVGEEVKAKNEKCLTRARKTRAYANARESGARQVRKNARTAKEWEEAVCTVAPHGVRGTEMRVARSRWTRN